MNSHPIDALPLDQGGSLLFTPCPGTKGVDLRTSIAQLKEAGAESILTLMTDDEISRFGVDDLASVSNENNLGWLHLPIEDDSAPGLEFHQSWEASKALVHGVLDSKGTIAIHCKGGSGRTGLMAAIILLERGIPREQVFSMVKRLRPKALVLQRHIDYLNEQRTQERGGE